MLLNAPPRRDLVAEIVLLQFASLHS